MQHSFRNNIYERWLMQLLPMKMKNFKLWVHQKAFSENELLINPKEFPDVAIGDILEIYHPDEENSHLLLQVQSFKDELQQNSKEIISIEQGVASLFQLRAYKNVRVRKVQPADVALDLVELVFKDQYISRSDMWRLKNSLVNTCIHIQQKLELSGIRGQVQELWSRWERVSCGAITNDTRVAFRSATAMVYLFIQMSSEMWDFDTCGDLYWEKAVGGFLTDLFNKWREKGVNNEVTVVLFSRTFFVAESLDQFPDWMQDNVKLDYAGRFYQDYYRAVVHHERREEWHGLLQTLKAHFTVYLKEVFCDAEQDGPIPPGYNSSSAQGNFLEALNMTLNVFDKHYVDRNFERTGQLVVLLTPGAGVFDVDREMCKITRQRMIDNGIGSDLVCLSEQPLHAVPLFRFHNNSDDVSIQSRDYNIPHWLNYSFYTKDNTHQSPDNFKPRIKLPDKMCRMSSGSGLPSLVQYSPEVKSRHTLLRHISSEHSLPKPDDIDYQCEQYDADVFRVLCTKFPKPRTPASMRPSSSSLSQQQQAGLGHVTFDKHGSPQNKRRRPDLADTRRHSRAKDESYHSDDEATAIPIPVMTIKHNPFARIQREATVMSQSFEGGRQPRESLESRATSISPKVVVVGSAGATIAHFNQAGQTPPRALVNPFGTSSLLVKLTSNRRRWTHTFPQDPCGSAIQSHHRNQMAPSYYASYQPHQRHSSNLGSSPSSPHFIVGRTPTECTERPLLAHSSSENRLRPSASGSSLFSAASSPSTDTVLQKAGSSGTPWLFEMIGQDHTMVQSQDIPRFNITASYDQEWSPYTLTGVDWKSLTATACLPVSTDFFPDRISLERDFLEFNYELLAEEDITGPFMTVNEIFQELISQRLLQGFQLVILPSFDLSAIMRSQRHPPLITNPEKKEYVLSIGRIFHKLCLDLDRKTISVTMYKPRHPSLCQPIQYTYQLWSVQNEGYSHIQTTFRHEEIERYNWNYLDNYISSHDSEFSLVDSLKFWRFRFLLIPNSPVLVKRFADEHGTSPMEHELRQYQTDAFLRFVEILNGIRRQTSTSRGSKTQPSSGRNTSSDMLHQRSSPGPDRQKHTSGTGSPSTLPVPPANASGRPISASRSDTSSPSPQSPPPAVAAFKEEPLSLCTPLPTIVKAMIDPSKGLRFITSGQKGITSNCFISGEAMTWVQRSLGGEVTHLEAFELLKNMRENKLIQHASGYPHIPFVPGYYVYRLVLPENIPPMTDITTSSHSWCDYIPLLPIDSDFPTHWFEIAAMEELSWQQKVNEMSNGSGEEKGFKPISSWNKQEMCVSTAGFGSVPSTSRGFKPQEIRNVMLEIDCDKTDRVEWCHVTYDGSYNVDRAFHLQVEWLVCTPSLLHDMLQGWSRKANTFGFHLVPAPTDPFHQHCEFANPLRCPLFIPLDILSLKKDVIRRFTAGECFESEDQTSILDLKSGSKSIDLFQELLMKKFDFILINDKTQGAFGGFGFYSGRRGHHMEYIHKSGVCFITLINSPNDTHLTACVTLPSRCERSPCKVMKASEKRRGSCSPMPVMVGRDSSFDIVDTLNDDEGDGEMMADSRTMRSGSIKEVRDKHMDGCLNNVGFLWSMNHMLTKRWRCSACGDEKMYESIMKELISMSRNVKGKLADFWLENKETLAF